jgi:hypothetical protein
MKDERRTMNDKSPLPRLCVPDPYVHGARKTRLSFSEKGQPGVEDL